MKFRNKILAGFAATVLALSMMVGSAMAQTDQLPFDYPNEANAPTNNDIWVVLYGGTAATPLTDDAALRDAVESVDVVITGKCSFNAELICNSDVTSWQPNRFDGQTVDGELVINLPYKMAGAGYAEVVVNLQNKTEGPLAVARMDFKDASGAVLLSHGAAAAEAAATDAAPKTGVESLGLVFGLGAAVLGSGAVVLKRKEK